MNEQERMTKRLARIEPELEQANKHIEKLGAENQALRASWLDAEDSHGNAVKELTQLRAENEALKAENLRYQAGLKRLVSAMDAVTHYPVDWNTFGHIRNQANDILVVINQAAKPAPTAQAASEVAPALEAAEEIVMDEDVIKLAKHQASNISTAQLRQLECGKPSKPKKPVPTRLRVNWGRGFSSGSYPVLGFSQEKQIYILDISTDCNRAMPKPVRFADCLAVQS